jgi:predicted RND superfamily exporter protein
VLAGWVTSLLGFVAIARSPVKALHDFAILGALGLTGAFVCVVMVLPPLLMLSDQRAQVRSRIRLSALPAIKWLGRMRRSLILVSLLMLLASTPVLFRGGQPLPFESDVSVMHPRPNPAIETQAEVGRRFGISPDSLTVYLRADSPLDLLTLAHEVDERVNRLGARISGTYGLATLLPDPRTVRSRRHAIGAEDVQRIVSDLRSALSENGFALKPFEGYGQFLQTVLTQKNAPAVTDLVPYRRLAETVLPASSFAGKPPTEAISMIFINQSQNDAGAQELFITDLRHTLAGLPGSTVTGLSVAGYDAQRTVRRELPQFIVVAAALVALYLLIHFRSLIDALLALLPAIFGIAVGAALLRLAGQKLNMVNLVALPLLIGIDVDYGIFLVNLARARRVRGMDAHQLAQEIEPATYAVVICAVATILGYVSLLWTSVPAEQSLGVSAAIGIGACVAGVLFLLVPTLFSLSHRE